MARFRYRLATLLRLREATRDERRAQLAEAYRALEILAKNLQEVEREMADLRIFSGDASQPGEVNIDRLLQSHRYELLLRAQRQSLQQQQRQVTEETERRRLALVEADRQVRVLEKLREAKWQEHLRLEEARDVKLMDEVAGRPKPQLGETVR